MLELNGSPENQPVVGSLNVSQEMGRHPNNRGKDLPLLNIPHNV
jgi:hypothetical protein